MGFVAWSSGLVCQVKNCGNAKSDVKSNYIGGISLNFVCQNPVNYSSYFLNVFALGSLTSKLLLSAVLWRQATPPLRVVQRLLRTVRAPSVSSRFNG